MAIGQAQATPQQQNSLARMLVQQSAVEMIQQIYTQTVVPANTPVLNINPRNVGLIKGFWVKVSSVISNTDKANALTPTDFGPANSLSQISFTDLNNNVRIQSPGWQMALLNSLRARRPYGAAIITGAAGSQTGYDIPMGYGSVYSVFAMPASIASGKSGTVTMWYWVPLAYSDTDYRGAIYANVVNATMTLTLTFPTAAAAFLAAPGGGGVDDLNAMYTGTSSASFTSATVTVYQVYMDQIPMGQNRVPILPMLDLSTIYEIKNSIFTGLVQNQDFPMQYSNFRDFLSTIVAYFNGTGRVAGTDVTSWALQSANFTNIWKLEPGLIALRTRNHLTTDVPKGCYYFGSRQKPIATTQYGNMELILNSSSVAAGAYCSVGYEDFALVNQLTMAGSLAAA